MILFGAQRDFMVYSFECMRYQYPMALIRTPDELTERLLYKHEPDWVFLPDWSHIVPTELLKMSQFVGFHCADLPNYRGGSPIQHQILDGLASTKLTAFRMTDTLDGGNILLQESLDLSGTATDIWKRIAVLVPHMIHKIMIGKFVEQPQRTGGFMRNRRTPQASWIESDLALDEMYDYIRMLDDPYPNAFMRIDGKRFSFSKPTFEDGKITATVEITDE